MTHTPQVSQMDLGGDPKSVIQVRYADLKHSESGAVAIWSDRQLHTIETAERLVGRLASSVHFARFNLTAIGPALVCRDEAWHACPLWVNIDHIREVVANGSGSLIQVDGTGWESVAEAPAIVREKMQLALQA